ncbi:MafI family immunity protein [bacterium]|nr:MafI family immunity protein [bacterium]
MWQYGDRRLHLAPEIGRDVSADVVTEHRGHPSWHGPLESSCQVFRITRLTVGTAEADLRWRREESILSSNLLMVRGYCDMFHRLSSEERFLGLVTELEESLSPEKVYMIRADSEAGEWGVAYDMLMDHLCEEEIQVTKAQFELLRHLASVLREDFDRALELISRNIVEG